MSETKSNPVAKRSTDGSKTKTLRRVLHPEISYVEAWGTHALTAILAKKLLNWETEEAYKARLLDDNPKLKLADAKLNADGDLVNEKGKLVVEAKAEDGMPAHPLVLTDLEGKRAICWNDRGNRDFDRGTALKYAQDILNRRWAGPTAFSEKEDAVYAGKIPYTMADGTVVQPGQTFRLCLGTVNGEDVLIDWSGRVVSAQHRLVGIVFAWQLWNGAKLGGKDSSPRWRQLWSVETYPDGPLLETGIKFGVSALPQIVQTLDACKLRTDADVICTSGMFDGESHAERTLLSKMLARMISFLWERVCDKEDDPTHQFKTHGELSSFIDRHGGPRGKLVSCLRAVHKLNKDRALSAIFLSPGTVAGMLWLMACSDTDRDTCYQQDRQGNPPTDKKLDWSRMGAAEAMIEALVKEDEPRTAGLAEVLRGEKFVYAEKDIGSAEERTAVIAKAWAAYRDGGTVTAGDCMLTDDDYGQREDGRRFLNEPHDFGGIDLGPKTRTAILTPEEREEAEQKVREEKAAEKLAKVEVAKARKAMAANSQSPSGVTKRVKEETVPPALLTYDKSGKPPVPEGLRRPPVPKRAPVTRKEVEAAQTAKALANDEADAALATAEEGDEDAIPE